MRYFIWILGAPSALAALLPGPALAQSFWGDVNKAECFGNGKIKVYARLWDIPWGTDWDKACKDTKHPKYGKANKCVDKGGLGMWGEWYPADASCQTGAIWGDLKDDGCARVGIRTYSSRLWNINGDWDSACRQSDATLNGQNIGKPTRCINKGISGMWGEWDRADTSCGDKAKWGSWSQGSCTGSGKRTWYSRLEDTETNSWDSECRATAPTISGTVYGQVDRCIDKGISGMWGEVDIADAACIPKVTLAPGKAARLCEQNRTGYEKGKGKCRVIFESGPKVYPNETQFDFDPNNFSIVIMSDPQFGYCESEHCTGENVSGFTAPGTTLKANEWHSDSLAALAAATPNFAGVIINGDLTNTANNGQPQQFEEWYDFRGFNLYLGLGNHDYDGYATNWCEYGGGAIARFGCAAAMLERIRTNVATIPNNSKSNSGPDIKESRFAIEGSHAYSFRIGHIQFVQLHNYPSYEAEFSVYRSGWSASQTHRIEKSLDWLDKELDRITREYPEDKIVINMHAILASAFDSSGGDFPDKVRDLATRDQFMTAMGNTTERGRSSSTTADWNRFLDILERHPNVITIFAGHLHDRVGQYRVDPKTDAALKIDWNVTLNNGRVVPVFFGGAAEFNRYPLVTFDKANRNFTVQVINSLNGMTTPYEAAFTVPY